MRAAPATAATIHRAFSGVLDYTNGAVVPGFEVGTPFSGTFSYQASKETQSGVSVRATLTIGSEDFYWDRGQSPGEGWLYPDGDLYLTPPENDFGGPLYFFSMDLILNLGSFSVFGTYLAEDGFSPAESFWFGGPIESVGPFRGRAPARPDLPGGLAATAVPEPSAGLMTLLGVAWLSVRRRQYRR